MKCINFKIFHYIKAHIIFCGLFCILFAFSSNLKAQQAYWVFFTDKHNVTFNPYTYFDSKAIERRISQHIPLYDSTDFPLNQEYVRQVSAHVDSVSQESRWFNALAVYAQPEQIERIKSFAFVNGVEEIGSIMREAFYNEVSEVFSLDESLLKNQLKRMGGHYFADHKFSGKGIRIAVFDAGFPSVDTHEAFEHIRAGKRIIKTWDFVKKRENVYNYSSHGTMTLSCIAGMYKGKPIGLATGAEFLLARTEMSNREPYSEEQNWVAAAEWADKNGAQIISSSLGYGNHRYFTKDMNGNKSLVSRAANIAASKGMLVVNSAGNEGSSAWRTIIAPADADSVLTIGGYDAKKNYRISFSSYGPTADKRRKPNVCAFGEAFVAGKKGFTKAEGTSFSCPLISGFAACAWESNTSLSNMELFREIEKSGDLYPYFDYAHGYGIPQAGYFTGNSEKKEPTFKFVVQDNTLEVTILLNEGETFGIYNDDDEKNLLLFYNIQNSDGVLQKYYVLSVYSEKPVAIDLETIEKGETINVSYRGYYDYFQK